MCRKTLLSFNAIVYCVSRYTRLCIHGNLQDIVSSRTLLKMVNIYLCTTGNAHVVQIIAVLSLLYIIYCCHLLCCILCLFVA